MLDLNCPCSGFLPIAVIPAVVHVNDVAAPNADSVSTHGCKSCARKLQEVSTEAHFTLAELELGRTEAIESSQDDAIYQAGFRKSIEAETDRTIIHTSWGKGSHARTMYLT